MKRIYSFDVFDTCLCRLCGDPRLEYDVLSIKVQKSLNNSWSETKRQLFVASRAKAAGETLGKIYHNMALHFPLPYPPDMMAGMELEIEREQLVPIVATLKLVEQLREKGSILFISDMYLPSEFIRERLSEYGFFKEGDNIFISEEVGAWKHNGTLYQLIQKQTGIPWRHWHHYGDNRHSDYLVPRRLGIHAHYIHYDFLPYEEHWRHVPTLQFPYPSMMAGIARAMRLSHDVPIDQKSFVCNLSAPFMLTWIVSILEDCLHNGTKKIFFLARDTHSEYIMAQSLATIDSKYSQLSIHYLLVSTKSINDDICLDYFVQEGVASKDDDVAIVDSRGRGYFIDNINTILSKGNYRKAKPYLLQLTPSHCDDQTTIACNNGANILHNILYTEHTTNKADAIKDIGWLIENILSLNYHQKNIGYQKKEGKIVPMLAADSPEICANGIKSLKEQQDRILFDYIQAYYICGLTTVNNIIMSNIILPTLTNFSCTPRKEYLKYLTRFSIYGKHNTYVHNMFRYMRTQGGRWQKGCIFYTLPRPLAIAASKIYDKIVKKHR